MLRQPRLLTVGPRHASTPAPIHWTPRAHALAAAAGDVAALAAVAALAIAVLLIGVTLGLS